MINWKQLFGLPRYFFVVYNYQLENESRGYGSCMVTNDVGGYISPDDLKDSLKIDPESKTKLLVITNITEVSKKDHDYFIVNITNEKL